MMLNAVLGGRSVALVVAVGLALIVLFAAAAWRSPKARTFGPIPWAAAMLVAGVLLADVAPLERRLILSSSALALLEVGIVAALATFFSSFSTPFLSSLLTIGMFVVGRSADSLTRLPVKFFGPQIHQAGIYLSKIVPNLHVYVPARPLLTGEALEANLPLYIGQASLASLAWAVFLLTAAALIFRRRDFL